MLIKILRFIYLIAFGILISPLILPIYSGVCIWLMCQGYDFKRSVNICVGLIRKSILMNIDFVKNGMGGDYPAYIKITNEDKD